MLIDYIYIFYTIWERHLTMVDKVLHCLEDNGFTMNSLKCKCTVKETNWLGYWLTPMGLKPLEKKVDTILDKISKSGYDSLTAAEKAILFDASKK